MTAVAVAVFLGTVDGSIVNIALPTIVDDFETSFAAVQWVPLSYLLTQATLVLGMGRIGDIAGRKAAFVAGFAVFILGSVLSGLAPGIGWLIGFRVLQGVGSALIFSMQFALVTESFPPHERGKALGLIGTIVSTGIISGPILGGIIIDAVDWRWIFYVNLPIGIVGILVALRYLPHSKPAGGERFDLQGGAAFFVALLTLLLGLTLGQERGFASADVVALYAVSAASAGWFLRTERRVEHPIMDLRMFESRDFSASLATRFATFAALAGVSILLPFYLTDVLGLAPREVGLAMTALPLAMGSIAPVAGSWSDRNGVRRVAVVGLVVLLIGLAAGAALLDVDTPIWAFVLVAGLLGLGFGTFQSPNNSAIMGSVPPERLGVASSLITVTRTTGWITGIAVLGTVWAARTTAYAGGGEAEDAPAAAQADGLGDVMAISVVVVLVATVLLSWVWRGRWQSPGRGSGRDRAGAQLEEPGWVPNLDSGTPTES
jgi:EmrB/QacA subfamily drug resistance transporter